MKKEIIKTSKIVVIGALLSLGVSYVFSGSYWYNAGGNPPGANVNEVVNTLNSEQTKSGSLDLENGLGTAKFSTDALEVYGLSYFGAKVDIGKKFPGGGGGGVFGTPVSTPDTNLSITGKLAVNLDDSGLTPTAGVHADGTMKLRPLTESENPGISYNATVCADVYGTLMLCDSPFGFSWNSTYVAQGSEHLECVSDKKTISVVPTSGTEPYTATWSISVPDDTEDDPTMTGIGLSRTITFWQNLNTAYSATITVTVDDASPTVDPITSTYVQNVPKQPTSLDGTSLCQV